MSRRSPRKMKALCTFEDEGPSVRAPSVRATRGPGRPPGSKNRSPSVRAVASARGPGRPPGSKNRSPSVRKASPKKTVKTSTRASPKKTVKKSPGKRPPTEFAKFFQKMNKTTPGLEGLSGAERMKIISQMWRDQK